MDETSPPETEGTAALNSSRLQIYRTGIQVCKLCLVVEQLLSVLLYSVEYTLQE